MKKNIFFILSLVLLCLIVIVFPSSCSAKTSLIFVPNQINKSLNEEFTFGINVQSTESIFGADLKITFDPKVVSIIKLAPGNFWVNPQVVKESIDQQNGIGNFSVFSLKTSPDQNNLAFITAKIISTNQSSSIISVDKESIIAGSGGQKILFEATPFSLNLITPTNAQSKISPTTIPPEEISPTPTLSDSESSPSITIKDQTTPPPPITTANSNNLIKIVAFILLIVGILAVIGLKKVG